MLLPNLACVLCRQSSAQPVCEFCKFDTQFLLHLHYRGNLLLYPAIARQFRHTSYKILRSCGEYRWPLDELIIKMKFHRALLCADILAEWFLNSCLQSETDFPLPQALLPVPIQPIRLWQRQFNQSFVIAKYIGKKLNVPVLADWASRHHSKAQHQLNRSQRFLNLKKAYSVHLQPPLTHVAIVDDVLTTGCTVDVLSKQLQKQHPGILIEVWTMALTTKKTLPDAQFLAR